MSKEEDRYKHSTRMHRDKAATRRQVRIAKQNLHDTSAIQEPHRYNKHHAMNCGNPNCLLCMNPRKSFGEKTLQEMSFEQPKLHNEE
jgi:predicted alpha/beta superfamily hydrolase